MNSKYIKSLVIALTACGALLLIVQILWIAWGVYSRYILRDPDPYVTEATALFLLPLAFVGMAYAMTEDAFPKVTIFSDRLPPKIALYVRFLNSVIMFAVGLLFAVTTGTAAFRSFNSGAASNILGWPEFSMWLPVFICLVIFTLIAFLYFLETTLAAVSGDAGRKDP